MDKYAVKQMYPEVICIPIKHIEMSNKKRNISYVIDGPARPSSEQHKQAP